MNTNKCFTFIALLGVAVLLSAFGGGGSGGGDNNVRTTYPRFAYMANGLDNSVSTHVADASTGHLKYTSKVDRDSAGSVAINPSGRYAYATNSNRNTVTQYTIGAFCSLPPMTTATVATQERTASVTTMGTWQKWS